MSDDIDNSEDKPKRKYIRRAIFGDPKVDAVFEEKVDELVDAAIKRGEIEDITDVEVVPEPNQSKPMRFLGEEPVNSSFISKIAKKLGRNKSMVNKPWKGKDRWVCESCKWETFDAKRARLHSC